MILQAHDLALKGRLAGASARLQAGQLTAICGPNGAGKSSLLACLAGLLAPDSGSVMLDGGTVAAMPARERARLMGYLPQGHGLAWDMQVRTLVALGRLPWQGAPMHRSHTSATQDARAIEAAIAAMELGDLAGRPVARLSGGERARAMLARVLAGEPRWILADEPLASLDLRHAIDLMALLRAQARAGVGVVVVLHDLAMAMNLADQVLVVDKGAVVASGTPEAVLDEALLARVWGIRARWLGEAGHRALVLPAGLG